MTALVVDVRRDSDAMVVVITGELDMVTAPLMLEAASSALAQEDVHSVRLDLSQLSFLDSSGLAALVTTHQTATTLGKSVVLLHPRPAQRRVLELMALETLFAIEPPKR